MCVSPRNIEDARRTLEPVVDKTPLQRSQRLSKYYDAEVYIKREDLNDVRSFKIRGAYNKVHSLSAQERKKGVVCASAGNHAQGVALSCALLNIQGVIFMPVVTPNQKINRVAMFGGKQVTIKLVGNTFDEASVVSQAYCKEHGALYVHPFDDPLIIAGQGTIGVELWADLGMSIDCVFATVGGGGLVSGIATYLKAQKSAIRIFGCESAGIASMHASLNMHKPTTLDRVDTFVDGAAVKTPGTYTFTICERFLDGVLVVPEGKVAKTMVDVYQNEGIVAEPAGALSLAVLDEARDVIKGKTVVCVLSGGNNDILRYPEILERSLVYQGLKHYFIIEFAQKPGQLRRFLNEALGPMDDIVRFEYIKKTNKEKAPALVGIELQDPDCLLPLLERMDEVGIQYRRLTSDQMIYEYLI